LRNLLLSGLLLILFLAAVSLLFVVFLVVLFFFFLVVSRFAVILLGVGRGGFVTRTLFACGSLLVARTAWPFTGR
jgi:hypothetical protein